MSAIEEKVALSADGAELVNRYLNELNKKLVHIGITDVYTIVSEAEIFFINEIQALNKETKVTVQEIEDIIKRHGTADEIIIRYKISQVELNEKNLNADPMSTQLMKRESNMRDDFDSFRKQVSAIIGYSLTVLPIVFLSLAMLQLNQHQGNIGFLGFVLDHLQVKESTATRIIVFSLVIFTIHEVITAKTGRLFFTVQNTIRARTAVRGILLLGAFSSVLAYEFEDIVTFSDRMIIIWFVGLTYVELLSMIRDHVPYLYPLEPEFPSLLNFIKIQYLLLFISLTLVTLVGTFDTLRRENLLIASFVILMIATILTSFNKYSVGVRFYSFSIMIPAVSTLIVGNISRTMLLLQIIAVSLIVLYKNHSYVTRSLSKTKLIL